MRKIQLALYFFLPACLGAQTFQLAAPHIHVDSIFFKSRAVVRLDFDLQGASIHYATTGTFPTNQSPVYRHPLEIDSSTSVRAIARHPDFISSPMAEVQVLKVNFQPDSVQLKTAPDSLYPGGGVAALFDLKNGSRDLKDGQWLGFRQDTVVVEVQFAQPVTCKNVVLSTLFAPESWVFPPARVEVLNLSDDRPPQYMGAWQGPAIDNLRDRPGVGGPFRKVLLRPAAVDRLQIRVIPYAQLPAEHPGAGQPAWLFLNEIVFQ